MRFHTASARSRRSHRPRNLLRTGRSRRFSMAWEAYHESLPLAPAMERIDGLVHPYDNDAYTYWIISSARSRTDCGLVRPSALAVLRLMTSSNLIGCWTGRSPGLKPLRILST